MHSLQKLVLLHRLVPSTLALRQITLLSSGCEAFRDSTRCYNTDSQGKQSTDGKQLLQYWQGLLGSKNHQHTTTSQAGTAKPNWRAEDLRDLLQTALRVRQGRVSGILPEQFLLTFVQVYQKTMGADDRLRLFHVLCREFGAQGDTISLTTPSGTTDTPSNAIMQKVSYKKP